MTAMIEFTTALVVAAPTPAALRDARKPWWQPINATTAPNTSAFRAPMAKFAPPIASCVCIR